MLIQLTQSLLMPLTSPISCLCLQTPCNRYPLRELSNTLQLATETWPCHRACFPKSVNVVLGSSTTRARDFWAMKPPPLNDDSVQLLAGPRSPTAPA